MPVRQKEIAAAAGVSLTTVSLALADHPRIPAKTRARVQALARQMGYQPDLAARALRLLRGRSSTPGFLGTLAMIVPQSIHALASAPRVTRWLENHTTAAESAGYRLEVFPVPDHASRLTTLDRILHHRGVTGLILAAANTRHPWTLDWSRYAVVASSWPHPCAFHSVGGDRFKDMQRILEEIRKAGYRRPGLIHPGEGFEGWVGAYEVGLLQQGLAPDQVPPLELREWNAVAVLRWWRRHRPDVIIANHGRTLAEDFAAAGVFVPREVAYVSPDVPSDAPELAGLIQPRPEIARLLIDVLHGQIRRHETGRPERPMSVGIQADWRPGPTLPALQKSRRRKS